MIKEFSNIEKILLLLVTICGALILFVPMHFLFGALIAVLILVYLLMNPNYCLYLVIFTIPLTERIRILPISFSVNDILVLICLMAVGLDILRKANNVSLRTRIDKWHLVLFLVYLFAGVTSIGKTGILTTFKFLEAIMVYYATVYLLRTKQVGWSSITKTFILCGIFQAIIGIFQSTTGLFGPTFQSDRGYLGYLGIGSKTVWHAWGTFGGNGMLPGFLVVLIFWMLPFHKYIKSKSKNIITALFLIAIYMGYSKESLFTFFVGILIYYYYNSKNKKDALKKIIGVVSITGLAGLILSHTGFSHTVDQTISGRFLIWHYPIYALSHNMKYLWFGAGLNSYWELIDPLLPTHELIHPHLYLLAHDYYLLAVEEMGIIGATVLFGFFLNLARIFIRNLNRYLGQYRKLNLAALMLISTVFTTSCFGQFYYLTFPKIMLYIFIAVILTKDGNYNKNWESQQ